MYKSYARIGCDAERGTKCCGKGWSGEGLRATGLDDLSSAFSNHPKDSQRYFQPSDYLTLHGNGNDNIGIGRKLFGDSAPLSNGNALADLGTYVKTDGSTVQMGDIDLAENTFRSRFADSVALTEQAQSLPDMQGSGQVRNLREAASLSTTLATSLGGYAAATTRSEQQTQLDALIEAWSETSAMATTATGAYAGHALTIDFQGVTSGTPEYQAWLDKLSVLERFNGSTFAQAMMAANTEWWEAA